MMRLQWVLLLQLLYTTSVVCNVWTQVDVSELTTKVAVAPEVELTINSGSACVYDNIKVDWKFNGDKFSTKNMMLAISITDHKLSFVTPLAKRLSSDIALNIDGYSKGTTAYNGIIQCETDVDKQFCVPKVQNIHSLVEQSKLTLEFNQDTNQPSLDSVSALDSALHFTPALFGTAHGEWTSPRLLEITVDPLYLDTVLQAFADKKPINIEPNADGFDAYETQGFVSFRPQSPGQLNILAFDRLTQQSVSNIVTSEIALCEENALLPELSHGAEITDPDGSTSRATRAGKAQPSVSIKGVFSVSGQDDIRFEHASLPFLLSGNWALSFWFRLLEGPTGVHRTLLYKGHPTEVGRTPSVWLLPDVNRLAIRLSTEMNADSGAESTVDIPLNQWTHIALVFANQTSSYSYSATLYVNGALDVSLKFSTPVVGNDGAVHLFKDVSHNGPRSFVSDLILWDKPLDTKRVTELFSQGLNSLSLQPVNDVLDLLLRAESPLLPSSLLSSTEVSLVSTFSSSGGDESAQGIAQMLLEKAKTATLSCDLFETRLDLYAEAAERGSAEALYLWAMMIRYGYESSGSGASCGYEKATSQNAEKEGDQERALLAFLIAADMGHAAALIPIALSVLTGLGLDVLLNYEPGLKVAQFALPVSREYISREHSDRADTKVSNLLDSMKKSSEQGDERFYKIVRLHQELGEYLVEAAVLCEWNKNNGSGKSTNAGDPINMGYSVLCPVGPRTFSTSTGVKTVLPDPTLLALGLLYVAGVHNIAEAHLILSYRYQYGLAVLEDLETACQYALLAAAAASDDYHKVGGQPIMEADRINDKTVREIPAGNTGDDDTLIQHQMVRASEGHIPSMIAMGDLYYYGARGLPRDQVAALRYFDQAAALGSDDGKCAAAGMYLKGEGTAQNTSRGLELYKDAAQRNSVRAFNGLGYVYFFGAEGVPKNTTEAFYYFLKAAESETESDSLVNAGYCLENGLGIDKDFPRAVTLYTTAAKKFGHFDAAKSLAWFYMEGREGVPRSPTTALPYLNAAKYIGSWAGWLRRGLDNYLSGNKMGRAMACYLHAGELGYEVSQSNAAYVLKSKLLLHQPSSGGAAAVSDGGKLHLSESSTQRIQNMELGGLMHPVTISNDVCASEDKHCQNVVQLVDSVSVPTSLLSHRLLARQYGLTVFHGNKENSLELGTCYFKGSCGVDRNYVKAVYYYTQASAQDNALASLYLGVMNHFGIGMDEANIPRANRYYTKALTVGGLETQLQYMTKLLQQSLSLVNHKWLSSFHLGLEYVVKMLWGGL